MDVCGQEVKNAYGNPMEEHARSSKPPTSSKVTLVFTPNGSASANAAAG